MVEVTQEKPLFEKKEWYEKQKQKINIGSGNFAYSQLSYIKNMLHFFWMNFIK